MAVSEGSFRGRSWLDLPSELLGLVLSRLLSHVDRIRAATVCRPWRTAARQMPPLLPLLALCDGTFLSLPDSTFLGLPDDTNQRQRIVDEDVLSRLSTGSTLFLLHGGGRCSLISPFSATRTIHVPELNFGGFRGKPVVRKVVVSNHLIAALIKTTMFKSTRVIASTRGQQGEITRCSAVEWKQPLGGFTNDIALFKGKIYILTTETEHYQRELHMLDGGQEQTIIRSIPRVGDNNYEVEYNPYSTDSYAQRDYLVVSGDRLLLVQRMINMPPLMPIDSGIKKRTRRFMVFEAADLSTGHGRWIEVHTLMGHALFVSECCSESLPAVGQCGDIGVLEDCIYFMNDDDTYMDMTNNIRESPMLDSGVYNMRDRRVMPLTLETAATAAVGEGPWSATWLFPET